MAVLRLLTCVAGVYSMFLLWAIAQERLSVPFQSLDGSEFERYHSALFLGTCQSALSAISSLVYILIRKKRGDTLSQALGLSIQMKGKDSEKSHSHANGNGNTNGVNGSHESKALSKDRRALLWRYFQCSLSITAAAPFGFAALSHISYPAMVLGKSCKLVPVLVMNVLLYRRRFAPHKYLVVCMVTMGITIFMHFGGDKGKSKKGKGDNLEDANNLLGVAYLLINLALDGATNAGQDEIFAKFKVTGQQMMFWINVMCTLLTSLLCILPLPYIPVLHPSHGSQSEFSVALEFIRQHPSILMPLAQFAFTGSLGQLFIFDTLQHFGSLTLVMVTLTRKMFTMILSVVVYNHKLSLGQWAGAGVVFAGISMEAWVKRKEIHAKRVMQEKEKANLKIL